MTNKASWEIEVQFTPRLLIRVVCNPTKMSVFGFLRTELNSNFENQKITFHGSV